MLITFPCTKCGSRLEIESDAVGSHVECPECHTPLTVPRKEFGPGTTIGGFRIEKLLGAGGMGQVFLAQQLSLGRDVALKILPSQMSVRKELVDRFLKEVQLLARLEHSNIVTAYEAGEDAGVLFLAMGYVKGDSLEAHLKQKGTMTEKAALELTRKVAGALAYAWNEYQLLHRDIKPANILLDTKGEPKLVDLGLAKSLTSDDAGTMSGTLMGTPNYMSPEQAQGISHIDFRTDMYSLGLTLYHMVTGQVPFGSSSLMEILRKQVTEPLPDARQFNPKLSEGCVALMEIMLAKKAEDRYESWEGLIEDLDWVLAGNEPQKAARGESTLIRKGAAGPKSRKKNRKPAGLIIGVAAAVVVLAGVGVWVGTRPGDGSQQSEIRSQKVEVGGQKSEGTAVPTPAAATEDGSGKGQRAYMDALEYVREHPEEYDAALSKFEQVRKDGGGTDLLARAEKEIARLKTEKAKAVEKVVVSLKADADQAVAKGSYADTLARLENYTGAFAADTATVRTELTAGLKQKQAAAEKATAATAQASDAAKAQEDQVKQREIAQTKLNALLAEAAGDVLNLDCESALKRVANTGGDSDLTAVAEEMAQAHGLLTKMANMQETILASFAKDRGDEINVVFKNGKTEKLTIMGVGEGKIKAKQKFEAGALVERDFRVADLSVSEKLRRLGTEKTPEVALMRGLLACEGKNWSAAEKEFGEGGPGLGAALVKAIGKLAKSKHDLQKEELALQAFGDLLKLAGAPADQTDVTKLAEAIAAKAYAASQVTKIQTNTVGFLKKFGATETAKLNAPVLDALAAVSTEAPFRPVPMKEATEENVKQALAALKAANRLKKEPVYKIEGDGITLSLLHDPALKDIRPLAGLPITRLDLYGCSALTDLRPLAGMPLTKLVLQSTKVKDLTPLGKTRTLEHLVLSETPVEDLSPLRGLSSLVNLQLSLCTEVKDLSHLRGLSKLTYLRLDWCAGVQDIAPLKSLSSLTRVFLPNTRIRDLSPLAGLPITELYIAGLPRLDLTPLSGMHFEILQIDGNMKSLRVLKTVSVKCLSIVGGDRLQNKELEKLPEYVPDLKQIDFSHQNLFPSDCPEFVFRFPALELIAFGGAAISVEDFKDKYKKGKK